MKSTLIRTIDCHCPQRSILAEAGGILRAGGLVAFPTETVYGLGANALDAEAVRRIFVAKGRPAHNPIIVHVAEMADIARVTGSWPKLAADLAAKFWPGPLTLVVPKHADVPDLVTAGLGTVGIRMPAHPVALGLIKASGVPLAAPSANRSGELSPTTAEHVRNALTGRIDMILDAGPTQIGLESTVVDLSASPPRVLRPGQISASHIREVVGSIVGAVGSVARGTALASPGMLPHHYAPHTPLECMADSQKCVRSLVRTGKRVGWLTFAAPDQTDEAIVIVVMPTEPSRYAATLYAQLHRLDAMQLDRIVVEQPPNAESWQAILDRLRRAAANTLK